MNHDSLIKQNAIKDPSYCPLCMNPNCTAITRMTKVEHLLWRCGECGAVHDERDRPKCPSCGSEDTTHTTGNPEGVTRLCVDCGDIFEVIEENSDNRDPGHDADGMPIHVTNPATPCPDCRPQSTIPATCPECGASYDGRDTDAVFRDCDNWKCGSWKVVDSGCFHRSKQCQEDSLVLRIASLTRTLAERDEELRVAVADNAELLWQLQDTTECIEWAVQRGYANALDVDSEKSVLSQPHPGQSLLDKLSRLRRMAEAAHSILVECDSELSAQAHGRPASDKDYLLRLSGECRRFSETIAALAALESKGETS